MKRKLRVKKTVIRSLTGKARVSAGIRPGWNCNSESCDLECPLDQSENCTNSCNCHYDVGPGPLPGPPYLSTFEH